MTKRKAPASPETPSVETHETEQDVAGIRAKTDPKVLLYAGCGVLLVLVLMSIRFFAPASHASVEPSQPSLSMPAPVIPAPSPSPVFEGKGTATIDQNQSGGIVNVGGEGRATVQANYGTVNIGVGHPEPVKPVKWTITLQQDEVRQTSVAQR